MPLTAEIAQRMIQASQDKARELGVAVCTAIVDANGRLFAFGRMTDAPWIITIPGAALMITVLGLNLLGDGLRDVLDPRLRIQQ